MKVLGYLRVSTDGQTTENQKLAIESSGFKVDEYFADTTSGSTEASLRTGFSLMMSKVVKGDTVVVTAVDRFGRDAEDVLRTINHFQKLGVKLRIMQFDGIDVTSVMGKMIVSVFASIAELERNMIIERTKAGIARTRDQGTKLGPPMKMTPKDFRELLERRSMGVPVSDLSEAYGTSVRSVYGNLTKWGDNPDGYEAEYNARQEQYERKV